MPLLQHCAHHTVPAQLCDLDPLPGLSFPIWTMLGLYMDPYNHALGGSIISSLTPPFCSRRGHWVSLGSGSQGFPGRLGPAVNGPSATLTLSLWAAEGHAKHTRCPGHLAGPLLCLREAPGPQQHVPYLGWPAGLRWATVHLWNRGPPWEGEWRLPAQGRPPGVEQGTLCKVFTHLWEQARGWCVWEWMHRAVSHRAEPLAISVSRRCLHLASRNARRQACAPRKFMVLLT